MSAQTSQHPVVWRLPPSPPQVRRGLWAWIRLHTISSSAIATLLVIALVVAAVVTIRQDVTTTPSSKAPDVVFQNGADYTSINVAGFATVTLGSSGASATLALSAIPGAAQTNLGNLLRLTDNSATQAYTVTLARSTTLPAGITSMQLTVKNGATTLVTWDPGTASSSSSFTLPVSTTLDISVLAVITDGTAAGALGSIGLQFTLAPA